jgi:hypothetical protein
LLGGRLRTEESDRVLELASRVFSGSLAGRVDAVTFGLSDTRNRAEVELAAPDVQVTVAAEGLYGSSPMVFRWLARMLAALLRDGIPARDEGVWELWEAGRRISS